MKTEWYFDKVSYTLYPKRTKAHHMKECRSEGICGVWMFVPQITDESLSEDQKCKRCKAIEKKLGRNK